MAEVYVIPRGTYQDFRITLFDADTGGDFLVDDTYSLTAKVWLGDDQQALASPLLLLDRDDGDTAPTANALIRIVASDTESLEPGDYLLQGFAEDSGGILKAVLDDVPCILRVTPTPGNATPRITWVSFDDIKGYNAEVDAFLSSTADQAGFHEQRAIATENFKRRIVDRYKGRPGYTRRRGSTYDVIHGWDIPDFATPPPSKAAVRAALDDKRVTIDSIATEILARMTLADIFGSEITNDHRSNPYREFAAEGMVRAEHLFSTWEAVMDLDDDGTDDAIIHSDVTFLGSA